MLHGERITKNRRSSSGGVPIGDVSYKLVGVTGVEFYDDTSPNFGCARRLEAEVAPVKISKLFNTILGNHHAPPSTETQAGVSLEYDPHPRTAVDISTSS